MTSSTPDALWSAPSLPRLRPAGIAWTDLRRGRLLAGCSLEVAVGTRLLVVGEPEAGASLLLRVLAGLARPRRGRVEIAGSTDPSPEGWGRRVAYVGAQPGIRSWMTPRESLRLAADLLGLPAQAVEHRIAQVVAWTGIPSALLDRSIRRGAEVAQRTAMACALLGDPEVLLLDEPLRSVGTAERRRILQLPGARRTMILASRSPATEEGLVSHVALLRRGRISLVAPVRDLEAAGLPLTTAGIAALADLHAAIAPASPGAQISATR